MLVIDYDCADLAHKESVKTKQKKLSARLVVPQIAKIKKGIKKTMP
tara:strand:+ start:1130 stop:1267 length:138 start_codon:yes stop_codon:yes gene_type:complete